jgi:hypothetical protein
MNEDLNPVETTVEFQPTVLTEAGAKVLVVEEPTTLSLPTIHEAEIVGLAGDPVPTEQFHLQGDIPSLDNLTDEQKGQLKELQKRMEMYNKSRSGHREGDTHKMNDGVSYLVTKSGAYNRIGAARKSRKATHRKEVAARRAGKS